MAQLGNLSSWAGTELPESPSFKHNQLSAARLDFIQKVLSNSFNDVRVTQASMLRDYEHGDNTTLFRHSFQGLYKADIQTPETVQRTILMHVKPNSSEEAIAFGDHVFEHLRKYGVETSHYLTTDKGEYQFNSDDYSTYFTDYSAGQHPFSSPDVLSAFGNTIGRMRTALDQLPNSDQQRIKGNSDKRYDLWREGLEQWKAHGSQFSDVHPNTRDVFQRCANFVEKHDLDMDAGTANHFDLIESNTLVYKRFGNAGFETVAKILDCDTLSSGWGPRHYDLGTFSFRVGLNTPTAHNNNQLPDITPDTLEPLRRGFNGSSETQLDRQTFAHDVMLSAALVMITGVGLEARQQCLAELEGHTKKMTNKVGRTIEWAQQCDLDI